MTVQASGGVSVGVSTDRGVGTILANKGLAVTSVTLANVPASPFTGMLVYCSNCRAVNTTTGAQEGAGVGTGSYISWNGSAWKLVGSNVTAAS